jgi:hypothetical protein
MRARLLARLLVGSVLAATLPATAAADPGDIDTEYGDEGRVVIEAVSSNVGVGPLRSDGDGRAVVTFTGDPESGAAALVSGDGSEVAVIDLGGPGAAAFGQDARLYAAFDESGTVVVARFALDGSLDTAFGTGGRAVVGVESAIRGDIMVGEEGAVVAGGVLGAERPRAWAARFDPTGEVDSDFGDNGIATLVTTEPGEADLVLATDVHATGDGYLAVVLTRALTGDSVTVVTLDAGGEVTSSTQFTSPDEIFSATSESLSDGTVMLAVQTTDGDFDTFHLMKLHPDGARDAGFVAPQLVDDEVGGPVRLTQLRTGPVAVAYNIGPDPAFVVRLVDVDGTDLGSMNVAIDSLWMYGMTALNHDGGLIFAVDETPVSSIEPDDLTLVKVAGDESGRFIDDDGSVHETDIEELANRGITKGCNPPDNTRFCPDDALTRGQMAAFLVRALDLAPAEEDAFVDDEDSIFEDDINRLAAAGITKGCDPPDNTRFCPDDAVTRAQMASFLVRSLPQG